MEISGNGFVASSQRGPEERRLLEEHTERMRETQKELQEQYVIQGDRKREDEELAVEQSKTSDLNTGKSLDITG